MSEYEESTEALRLPPLAAEEELGYWVGLCLNNGVVDDVRVRIGVEDFYRGDHKAIYQSITDIIDLGQVADVITVNEELLKSGQSGFTGGLSYLGMLAKLSTYPQALL